MLVCSWREGEGEMEGGGGRDGGRLSGFRLKKPTVYLSINLYEIEYT